PPETEEQVRQQTIAGLQAYVAGMNLDNFIVRPHRRSVEKFQKPESWNVLDGPVKEELVERVAPLPPDRNLGNEPAKRFDLLMSNLELGLLRDRKSFDRYRRQLLEIDGALEEQFAIPVVRAQQVLILEIQTDPWWEGITVPLLELVRIRLRNLVQHIDRTKQQ